MSRSNGFQHGSELEETVMTLDIKTVSRDQQAFFRKHQSKDLSFRIEKLKQLKSVIQSHEQQLLQALFKDLGKHEMEAYSSDIGPVLHEIDTAVRKVKKWAAPKKVKSPLILFPAASYIYPEPLGSVLIIGAWNYPVQLVLSPLVGAMAAGNCAVIKPSEISEHTSKVIARMINQTFEKEYITVVEGGVEETRVLLDQPFDHLFFTGSTRVGKIVMSSAAKHLTPVTLELGGKNPCIVDKECDLDLAGRRIAWGKYFNAGQTCIAPDYLLVHSSVKDALISALKKSVIGFYSKDPANSSDYGRIINDAHFSRIAALMAEGKIVFGGQKNPETRFIAPTIIEEAGWHHNVMQEEIFGPLLPILTYDDLDQVIEKIAPNPKPLALYFFSSNPQNQEKVITRLSAGGISINDTFAQIMNTNLPFGGVGESGTGGYHGRHSFDTFSHAKGVVKRKTWADPKTKYPPYKIPLSMLKKGLKYLY